jgi:hypothetical protein
MSTGTRLQSGFLATTHRSGHGNNANTTRLVSPSWGAGGLHFGRGGDHEFGNHGRERVVLPDTSDYTCHWLDDAKARQSQPKC